ncbi:MAG: hypothetical protein WCT04_20120 [Planctomycetota bacterium]
MLRHAVVIALFVSLHFALNAADAPPAPAKPVLKISPGQVTVPTDKMRRPWGELISVDLATRTGKFRKDGTDEILTFTALPYAEMLHHATFGDLRDFKVGERLIFRLHENEAGEWVWLTYIQDQMNMMNGHKEYFHVDTIDAAKGQLTVSQASFDWNQDLPKSPAWNKASTYKIADTVTHEGATMIAKMAIDTPGTPPAEGKVWTKKCYLRERGIVLETDAATHYWKNGEPATFADIKIGDKLRTKTHGIGKGKTQLCWDIFLDEASLMKVQNEAKAVHAKRMVEEGLPGYVDRNEEKELRLTLFQEGGEFAKPLKVGQKVTLAPAGVDRKATTEPVSATVTENKAQGNLIKLELTLDAPNAAFHVKELARVWVTQAAK